MNRCEGLIRKFNEKIDVKEVISDLINTPSSDKNEDQGKFVQLLKGIAFSDEPVSDEFMKKLMDTVNDKNFGEFIK